MNRIVIASAAKQSGSLRSLRSLAMTKSSFWSALNLAWELGYIIALPIAILAFGGALLDKKLGTSPLFILIGIILSLIISATGIYRKIKKIT